MGKFLAIYTNNCIVLFNFYFEIHVDYQALVRERLIQQGGLWFTAKHLMSRVD